MRGSRVGMLRRTVYVKLMFPKERWKIKGTGVKKWCLTRREC